MGITGAKSASNTVIGQFLVRNHMTMRDTIAQVRITVNIAQTFYSSSNVFRPLLVGDRLHVLRLLRSQCLPGEATNKHSLDDYSEVFDTLMDIVQRYKLISQANRDLTSTLL